MTLTALFKNEIETTDDPIDAGRDPAISGFLAGILATVDDRDDLSADDRERVKALATGPGRPETRAELIQRLEDLSPYLPGIEDMVAAQPAAPTPVPGTLDSPPPTAIDNGANETRVYLLGVSTATAAGTLTPIVSV